MALAHVVSGVRRPSARYGVLSAVAVAIAVVLAACVQEIERPAEVPPTVAPSPIQTSEPAALTRPTPEPPTPVATARPTATVAPEPTVVPTPRPTATPQPTANPAPTATPVPAPVAPTPTPVPAAALVLEVFGPEPGASVLYDAVVVHGVTAPGASVTINGQSAEVDADGGFRAEIPLSTGENSIDVTATGNGVAATPASFVITSLALPPLPLFLIVTDPEDQTIVSKSPVRVAGRTTPDAVVSVNGVSLPLDSLGVFESTVALQDGPNIIDVVATGPEGDVLDSVLAIIYRPD